MNILWFDAHVIAPYLSAAHPAWSKQDIQQLLDGHQSTNATDKLKVDWEADVAALDGIYNEALRMGDTSLGEITQEIL